MAVRFHAARRFLIRQHMPDGMAVQAAADEH